jgi:phosphate:Na+ symporter
VDVFQDISKLLAGTGMFLFAMYLIEESLRNISGRNFKLFLQKMTRNRVWAATGGALVTAVLQSSSMVSLIVLAFVGAGVFTLKNAMAVILGANLGTTIDSWMVATLGFKANIEIVAYPLLCIGALLLVTGHNRALLKYISYFLLGFSLLFIGLAFMKDSFETLPVDFEKYAGMPALVFVLIGFIITLIVQSSSVTMALTLSAIFAGHITFPMAAAIVLGSETGTTIKIVMGSLGGTSTKKRVALGNFFFNLVMTLLAFIFLTPILYLITDLLHITDPLIGIVTFSTFINLLTIFLFLPLLDPYARFLERFFKASGNSVAAFISNASKNEPETSLDLFRKETQYFIYNSMLHNLECFEIEGGLVDGQNEFDQKNKERRFMSRTLEDKYDFLKQLQGELQEFYIRLRPEIKPGQIPELSQLISALRSSMYATKCIKDIRSNIANLRRSSKNVKHGIFLQHQENVKRLYQRLNELILNPDTAEPGVFRNLYTEVEESYTQSLNDFYPSALNAGLVVTDITTVLNFNRELFTANKAILIAAKDLLLEENEAEELNAMIAYKT